MVADRPIGVKRALPSLCDTVSSGDDDATETG
jgi:hypothetical protein